MRLPIQVQGIVFRKISGRMQYLLLRRNPSIGRFWQPVTGGLEEGETKIEALKREVLEETGIRNIIRIVEDVHYYEFTSTNPFCDSFKRENGQALLKEYVFGVEISSNEKIVIGWEHSEYRWVGFEEALKLLKWKENKEALKKLDEILRTRD